jgi:hypothetical protein
MNRLIHLLAAGLGVVLLAACGSSGAPAGSSSASGAGMTVTVSEPAANSTVTVPFTVKVSSSVPLGPKESGAHHVHIWFDSDDANYKVVEAETTEITSLAGGAHTMHVSLRNADHSAAGVEVSVPLTVGGSGGGTQSPGGSDTGPPPSY